MFPRGKGYFIWQLERCAGGDPARLAAMAHLAGLGWVSFKIHNGIYPRNGDISRHVRALAAVGCASWGWGYCYGYTPEQESRIAISRCREMGLAGYMLNAEYQYKAPGMATMAQRAMSVFTVVAPSLPIGLCSYRFPSLHRTLPWREFLAGCTFHNPQVYWLENGETTAPVTQLARSLVELRAIVPLPVVPLGVASPNDANTWQPTVAQLVAFHQAAIAAGLEGHGWWSWEHAERRLEVWEAIARMGALNPSPSLPDPVESIRGQLDAIEAEIREV